MEQNRLVLHDGTTIVNGFASKSSNDQLMIRVPGDDIVQAAYNFSSPERTQTITCYYGAYKYTYTGFTSMYSVQYFAPENHVELWLKPPANGGSSYKRELTVPEVYMPIAYTKEEANANAGESDNNAEN